MTPPNILIFKNELLPRSETFIREQAESLDSFVPHYVGLSRVDGLELPQARTTILAPTGSFGDSTNLLRFKVTLRDSRFFAALRALQPALIHAHFQGGGIHALHLAELLNVPLITTCHGNDVTAIGHGRLEFVKTRIRQKRLTGLWKRSSRFIAISKFIRLQMIERGYPEDKIGVHYIGVDVEKFRPDETVERKPIVLFVGRLVEKKGCDCLIRAVGLLQKENPELELVIIGDGPLRKSLESLAKSELRKFRFLGSQPPAEILRWMRIARVFSVPSIRAKNGDAEGLGIVFCEAQAAGLPVASFQHGGIPEVVENRGSGLLAEEGNWRELAENIGRLLTDDAAWKRFSVRGRERMIESFNLQKQCDSLENIYHDVIAQKSGNLASSSAGVTF